MSLYRRQNKKSRGTEKSVRGADHHTTTHTVPPELSLNYIILGSRFIRQGGTFASSGKLFSGRFSLYGTGSKDISHVIYYITEKTVCQEILS